MKIEIEAHGKIKIMDLDIDEDFQIMDDVFCIDNDGEIPLVLEEETLCCLESNLVGEELLSIPKLVFVNEENIQCVVTVESKETKVAGRSKKRNSDDWVVTMNVRNATRNINWMCFFKKHVIQFGK